MMPEPLKLFISYRSSDASKVDKIAGDLALLKHEDGTTRFITWQDKKSLPAGHPNWWDAIVDAIIDCDIFVFHISQESLKSEVCQAELEYAHKRSRPIIPIVLEGEFIMLDSGKYTLTDWSRIPEWLTERQLLFYTGSDAYPQVVKAVALFQKHWPEDTPAKRPLHPDRRRGHLSTHALYRQAHDYAEKLAFLDAEVIFRSFIARRDPDYEGFARDWLSIMETYQDLIEVSENTRFLFKKKWDAYTALFPKDFLEGLFDPKGFASKSTTPPPRVETPPPAKGLTPDEYLKRGNDFYSGGDYDRAIADYTQAIRLNPQYASAYINRGTGYYTKKDYDRAIADYTQAIRINPKDTDAYVNRGILYNDVKKDYDRAIADYTQAIRLNPQYAHAYYGRGLSYHARGNIDRAIADYTQTIRINPYHAEAYYGRGISYKAKGDIDRAIADHNEAIRLNPQHANAYNNRGSSYDDKGEYDRAIADYTQAIRLNPQYANAYNNRGVSYYAKKDYDRAIADYDRALQINPNIANAANNRKNAIEAKRKQGR